MQRIYDMRTILAMVSYNSRNQSECAIAAYLMDDGASQLLLDAISGNFIHQSIHKAVLVGYQAVFIGISNHLTPPWSMEKAPVVTTLQEIPRLKNFC
ncbi:MAG: hypothetical protein H6635_03150 [Anaerolineales bacterium]|nr:hypothetical protein [Anaerolineales bacterium]